MEIEIYCFVSSGRPQAAKERKGVKEFPRDTLDINGLRTFVVRVSVIKMDVTAVAHRLQRAGVDVGSKENEALC
jgi:hypothetical protein